MASVTVLDSRGKRLSPCTPDRARDLVHAGRAILISDDPLVVQLDRAIDVPEPQHALPENPLLGKRLLLHICCAPCATFTVTYLREQGAQVTGLWFNPNIHPFSEHQRRQDTLERYAREIDLDLIYDPGYRMVEFLRGVAGHERFRGPDGGRCRICYRMRLERTAEIADPEGFDLFSTTLLISPYQDIDAIHEIGDSVAQQTRASFYFENLRRGFAKHHALSREHHLYMQRYCGCIYSEWEALDRNASTLHSEG